MRNPICMCMYTYIYYILYIIKFSVYNTYLVDGQVLTGQSHEKIDPLCLDHPQSVGAPKPDMVRQPADPGELYSFVFTMKQ